ncbi:MAG TPA: hypothetical protein VMR33_13580 [Candidatus Baltobacteraceae bacterium]|nr:hypothetical protein [Candidatus Baltobacteraceae bacterium]
MTIRTQRTAGLRAQHRDRTVHAKDMAAFGTLTITRDITKYSKAVSR